MKIVYLAGPLRGKNGWQMELNIRRAEELSLRVWQLGAACICPHSMNRYFFGALGPHGDQMFLDGDFEIIRRCDAILFTPDWKKSTGARAEHKVAKQHGITILYDLDELEAWLVKEEDREMTESF
jgi:hypothetical protein